jgi:APA family basic amino acid/polyamine antiporter
LASLSGGKKVFLRDATGLVRQLTALDAYIMAVSVISIGGAVQTSITLLGLYPGADLVGAFTLGLIPAIAFILVYSIQTAAFPRSGGDYVWVSRISGFALGFTFSWLLQFSYLFAVLGLQSYYVAWIGVPSALTAIGVVTHSQYLIGLSTALSSSQGLAFLVCLVFLVLGGLVCVLGPKVYAYIMRILWVYGMFGILVWVGLLLSSNKAAFVSSFNTAMAGTTSYDQIIQTASSQGLLAGTNLGATMIASLTLGWTAWAGFNYSVYASGEIKNVTKSVPIALTAGLITSWAFLIGVFALSANAFGADFVAAMSALSVAGNLNMPVGPSMSFLISMLTNNPILLFIVTSTLIVWWFMILPPLYMAGSRIIFAWSYDRMIPAKLADVNDRLHSPIYAILLCVAANAVWAFLISYTVYGAWISLSFIQGVGWAVPGFVAAAFPYVKKDLYQRTVGNLPKAFSRRIAGVPILTIGGLLQGILMVFYTYSVVFPTFTYTNLAPAITNVEQVLGLVAISLLYVFGVRAYHKSRGLDLRMVFQEIPPE